MTAVTVAKLHAVLVRLVTRSSSTNRIASPVLRPVLVPASHSEVVTAREIHRQRRLRPHRVVLDPRCQIRGVSNVCRRWPGAGTLCTRVPAGIGTGSGAPVRIVEREGEQRRGGDAGRRLITHEPRQLEHRALLHRGAQIRLVRQPLLVEGQDIGRDRQGVQQRDGEIVVARASSAAPAPHRVRIDKRGQHARLEAAMAPTR